MPPPDVSGTGLLSDKDKDDVADALGSGDAATRAIAGRVLGGLLSLSGGYKDAIVREKESKSRKSSEKFGDLEFTAEVKSKLGPSMSGYYSSLLKDPSKFMHILKQKEKVHPDDLLSLDKWVGGWYSKKSNPVVPLDYILEQTLGPNWHAKKQNPHQGSPYSVFKKQAIQPGHLYLSPRALTGSWDPKQLSKKGHPLDIWGHELGHSARSGLLGETGVPDESIQRYEDSLYGLSRVMKDRALESMGLNKATLDAPLAWGNAMKELQGSNAWATPYGLKPTLRTPYEEDQWNRLGPRQRRGVYR